MKNLKKDSVFKIVYHKRSLKFLEKISQEKSRLIVNRLEILQSNPHEKSLNVKIMSGEIKNAYRLRVGKIRVLYQLLIKSKTIYIYDINFRGSIYKH